MARTSDDFKYDVFISYSHRDEAWVQKWLLPKLEDDFELEVQVPATKEAVAETPDMTTGDYANLHLSPNSSYELADF